MTNFSTPISQAFTRAERVGVQWLVSVRNMDECRQSAQFAVDIIDFKEPMQGALAPVAVEIWNQAADWSDRLSEETGQATAKLSAALGEREQMSRCAAAVPDGFSFAKVGPSGCSNSDQLTTLWRETRDLLSKTIELVAVAYADAKQASCVEPEVVLREARRFGIRRFLIDTFTKRGQSSIDMLGVDRLQQISEQAAEYGIWWALAGSITLDSVHSLSPLVSPNCYAIRGDVCDGERTEGLSSDRLQAWKQSLWLPSAQNH